MGMMGQHPGMNPASMNPNAMNPNVMNSAMNPGMNPAMNPGMNPSAPPGMHPGGPQVPMGGGKINMPMYTHRRTSPYPNHYMLNKRFPANQQVRIF